MTDARTSAEVPPVERERAWRLVASLVCSGVACVVALLGWWPSVPVLRQLATETFPRPIRPMGLVVAPLIGVGLGYLVGMPLGLLANKLSKRPAAEIATALAFLVVTLPGLNFLLFTVILVVRVFVVRSVELGP